MQRVVDGHTVGSDQLRAALYAVDYSLSFTVNWGAHRVRRCSMTINNPHLYIAGVWDWAILDGCFGQTRIRPTDVDGLVERNGKCLFIETKAPGVAIPYGQRLMHKALLEVGFAVMIVWGETNAPCSIKLMTPSTTRTYETADIDTFRGLSHSGLHGRIDSQDAGQKAEQKC